MGFYNPFRGLFSENQHYRSSRLVRTGFWRKFGDTFLVISGHQFSKSKDHVGLFDYATFMIPNLIDRLTAWCWKDRADTGISMALIIPSTLLTTATNSVRYTLAAAITLAVSPLIGIVHGFAQIKAKPLKSSINQMPITVNPKNPRTSYQTTLGEFLKTTGRDYDDIRVHCVGNNQKVNLEFHSKISGLSGSIGCQCCLNGDYGDGNRHILFSADLPLNERQEQESFKSLLELNVGGLSRKLEKKKIPFSIFKDNANEKEREQLQSGNSNVAIDTHKTMANALGY